jgi:hypothetical protein
MSTLDTIDQLVLANECLLVSVGRPEVHPVVFNLFSSDKLLDPFIGDNFFNILRGLPEPVNITEPPVVTNLVMRLIGKMVKVRAYDEFEFLCDIGLDLLDVYRNITGITSTEINVPGNIYLVGTRQHFIGITASMIIGIKYNQLLITLPPIEQPSVNNSLSKSGVAEMVMSGLTDGSYFTDKVYEYVLNYKDDQLTLEPNEQTDESPVVVQEEDWPDLISAHEN